MASSFAPCDAHPERRAGWRCEGCGGALCPACTGQRKAGMAFLDVCARCGAMAAPIRERRALLQPFERTVWSALGWAFADNGPLALLLWGLAIAGLSLFGGAFVAVALFVGWLFHVARTTAAGHDELPGGGDYRGYWEDIVAPMTRLALATLWFLAPLVLLLWGGERSAHPALVVVICAVGLAFVPISLIASAVETPLAQILNPVVLARYALMLGSDYARLLLFTAACFLSQAALLVAGRVFAVNPVLLVLLRILSLALPLAFFRAVGLLLRARGDDLGYGRREDYLDRVLGDAPPEAGVRENMVGSGLDDERRRARGVDRLPPAGEEAPAPSPINSPRALEFEGGDAPAAASAPLELVTRLRAQDTGGALAVLEQSGGDIPALTLSADGWLALAQAGAAQKRVRPALVAAKRALEVAPEGPAAPRAWLLAARLYDEGMENRAESDRLLAELVRRFPQSAEAAFAQRRLKP